MHLKQTVVGFCFVSDNFFIRTWTGGLLSAAWASTCGASGIALWLLG
jgi:hypothetical protein